MTLSASPTTTLPLHPLLLLVPLSLLLVPPGRCGSVLMHQPRDDSICARSPHLQILDVSVTHFDCQVLDNDGARTLLTLNCSDRGVPALPRTSDTGVPRAVQALDFSHNHVRCLPPVNNTSEKPCRTGDCHAGCLRELDLSHNDIDFVHRAAFDALPCLRVLDLSANRLTNASFRARHFSGLYHLTRLDLHGNPLGSLPDNLLVAPFIHHLQHLNLSSCRLHSIGSASVNDLLEMEDLDLSHNQITRLDGVTFQGLTALRVLDLSWNRLQVIAEDTFGDLGQLTDLRLEHNMLHTIHHLSFHRDPQLSVLSLSHNAFTDIPVKALAALPRLEDLTMNDNAFTVLRRPADTRVNTTVLRLTLDFQDHLQEVEAYAFSAFPRMTTFSLRTYARELKTLHAKAFRGSTKYLTEVRLDHNGLTSLDSTALPWGRLELLTLDDNQWLCNCWLAWAAGKPLGNTTVTCHDPLKLAGQALADLRPDELSCPTSLTGVAVLLSLCVAGMLLTVALLVLWQRRRSVPCRCIRGTYGRYISVYTKNPRNDDDDDGNGDDGSCGDGQIDDLDLGQGSEGGDGAGGGGGGGGGRVMIMLNTLRRNGYKRLAGGAAGETDSTQDLTLAV